MVSPISHVQCWDGCTSLANVRRCIRNGHPVLVLMRGVPGSGKSFLARELLQDTSGLILSTDNLFLGNRINKFDPSKLQENHKKTINQAKAAFLSGVKPIIIDNTNIYVSHMSPYVKQAVRHHYEIYFVEPETEWKHTPEICALKSVHNVEKEKISYLMDTFERVTLASLIRPVILELLPPLDIDLEDEDYLSSKRDEQRIRRLSEGTLKWPDESEYEFQKESCTNILKDISDGKVKDIQEARKDTASAMKVEDPNDFQLFSLLPEPKVCSISCRTVGVQTSDIIRTLIVGEIINVDDVLNAVITKLEEFSVEKPKNVERIEVKDRVSQTTPSRLPTELDLLLALFPNEAFGDLQHLLHTCGLEKTVHICLEMHAKMDLFSSTTDNIALTGSDLPSGFEFVAHNFANTVPKSQLVCTENIEDNAQQKLPPSSSKQRCSPDPIEDGYYRMELSLDMIQKLSVLFDNESECIMERAYADLPMWFCRQLFEYWRKLPISSPYEGGGFKCNDFNLTFPSVSPISSSYGTCEDGIISNIKCISLKKEKKAVQRKLTTAQKLQLNYLYEKFPSVDRNRIEECYFDTDFSKEAVENTLNLFLEQDDSFDKVDNNKNLSISNCTSDFAGSKVFNSFEKNLKIIPENLRTEAEEIQDEIDYCNQQKSCLYNKAACSKSRAVNQFYISDAQEYDKRAKSLISQRNALMSQANDSRNFVDLHLMSVPAAIKLLKEKLNCLDRPQNLRRGRSDRKLVVVTGYGKSSIGAVKIKPAVLQWLNQLHYDYYLSNPGEIIVTAK